MPIPDLDDIARLTAALPDARFIVVDPFWCTDLRPDSVEMIIGWVKDAAANIGAGYIPGASHWIEGIPRGWPAMGSTPTMRGTRRWRVERALR